MADPGAMPVATAPPLEADIVIVGAGPAGLAAASAATRAGLRVLLVDAAPAVGGQIWRARLGVLDEGVARTLDVLRGSGVTVLAGTRVVMPLPDRTLLIDGPEGARRLRWRQLVLATGARERLLPFPGWTLPGVFGAGGLQALVKGGWPIAGRRVLVAGTGPLLLAVGATLKREGARVVGIVEEAPASSLARFGGALLRQPRRAFEALRLAGALRGVPCRSGTCIVAAQGDGRIQRVVLGSAGVAPRDAAGTAAGHAAAGAGHRVVDCDVLAAGWGLVPQAELAQVLGCALAPRFGAAAIVVDAAQRTNVPGVLAAGECVGVAGVRAARLQGRIAGAAAVRELEGGDRAAARQGDAAPGAALARELRFAAAVARVFPPPSGWPSRLESDTLVCRCEDVAWSALREHPDLRSAKLATRCGMGHCQGRLCHDALALAIGGARLVARPPLTPVALGAFLAIEPADGSGTTSDTRPFPSEETPS